MKKICAYFAAILFIVSAVVLLTSCMQQPVETQATETQAATEIPTELVTSDNSGGHQTPPKWLQFSELSECSSLFSAVEMEKEELEIYLDSKNYDINGIYTKDDIVVLEKIVSKIPYPSLVGAELEFFRIYTDDYHFFVRYRLECGGVQVKVYTDSYPAKKENLGIIQTETLLPEKMDSYNHDVLYFGNADQTPQGVPRLTYGAIVDDYHVSFMMFDMPRGVADEIVKSIAFDTLEEILKTHNSVTQSGA